MAFLELTNVRKAFAEPAAVDNFNLKAETGEFISFLGHRAGKTTTLRMIAGFEIPTSGTIVIDGKDMTTVRLTSATSAWSSNPMLYSPTSPWRATSVLA